jgi:hypothetical protein
VAYGVKYRIEYKDYAGVDKRIDIEELNYTGAVTNCTAGADPLQIEVPTVESIYTPVVSSGCTINMISADNLMFLSLYSINPKKIRVRIYAASSTIPYFIGYGNTEIYSEGYSRLTEYDASLYCNDGFAILERFKFIDGTVKYASLETLWNILTRIITKMELPFETLNFACCHNEAWVTPLVGETIFHQLWVDQANYYDEKDEPMTYRQVLEAILKPFGLTIRWINGSLIICDLQMLVGESFDFKVYDSSFAYSGSVSASLNYDISLNEINWDNEDQKLDIEGGYCRQKIRYSPYIPVGAINEIDITDRKLWLGTEIWTQDSNGIYRLSGITSVIGINMLTNNVKLSGRKAAEEDDADIYFARIAAEAGYDTPWLSIPGYKVGWLFGQFLKIEGEVFIQTKNDEYGYTDQSVVANRIEIPVNLEIDGKGIQWNPSLVFLGFPGGWEFSSGYDLMSSFKAVVNKSTDEVTVCDQWKPFSIIIPGISLISGEPLFKVADPQVYGSSGYNMVAADGILQKRLRGFKVRAFDGGNSAEWFSGGSQSNANEISTDDAEYIGELGTEFISEGPEITLFHADAKNITDRGAIRRADKSYTGSWNKPGDIASYRLVDLLLRSIHSQYQDSLIQLSGTIEADKMIVNGGPLFLFTIQDSEYLGDRKFVFLGGTYNDFYNTLNGVYLEIKQEDLTISMI